MTKAEAAVIEWALAWHMLYGDRNFLTAGSGSDHHGEPELQRRVAALLEERSLARIAPPDAEREP